MLTRGPHSTPRLTEDTPATPWPMALGWVWGREAELEIDGGDRRERAEDDILFLGLCRRAGFLTSWPIAPLCRWWSGRRIAIPGPLRQEELSSADGIWHKCRRRLILSWVWWGLGPPVNIWTWRMGTDVERLEGECDGADDLRFLKKNLKNYLKTKNLFQWWTRTCFPSYMIWKKAMNIGISVQQAPARPSQFS